MARHVPTPAPAWPDMRVRHVVFVNDNPLIRKAMEAVARRSDRLVVTAVARGHEALTVAERIRVDLLISDIERPAEDTWDFLEWFHGVYPDVPIALVSASFAEAASAPRAGELLQTHRHAQKIGAVFVLAPHDLAAPEIEETILRACET